MTPVLLALLLQAPAWAGPHTIAATVVDRNGQGLGRTRVRLVPRGVEEPRSVELVTDRTGAFLVDYLRDADGERTKLAKKREYDLEVYKPGYHVVTLTFGYKRGAMVLEPVVLVEETIEVQDLPQDIAPSTDPENTHAAGANYEGQ